MQSKKTCLIIGLSTALLLLSGCVQTGFSEPPPAPSESAPASSTIEASPMPTASPPEPKLLELTKEAVCERYHFSVKYPDTWTAVIESEKIDAPDQGVIIFVDKKKDLMSSLRIYGDMRGQIHPGTAGEPGSAITDFSTPSGITGKRYGLLDADGVRWDKLIFGEDEDYAILIRLDNAFYLEYEPTINAIIDSFTFLE